MNEDKHKAAGREIRFTTYLSVAGNVLLFVVKIVAGLAGGSVSLVADGIHSLSDMSTDGAILLGHYLGSKKPDHDHPYGHGRIETFSAIGVAAILVVVGGGMVYYAGLDIARGNVTKPGNAVIAIAIISVACKEVLYRITKAAAVRSHSAALYANAWHHRTDALSSIAVVAGIAAQRFTFVYGDQVAGIVVGLMVVVVGGHILANCLGELTEAAVDQKLIDGIKGIINSESSIRHWHKLRSRTVGREVFMDVHILVDPELNICEAHEIAERLEHSIQQGVRRPINVMVHVEPDLPELRV